jgi:hypothetical protein
MRIGKWSWKKTKPKKLYCPRSGQYSFLGFKLNRAYLLIVNKYDFDSAI